MSKMKDFVAFQALVSLLKEQGKEKLLEDTCRRCRDSENIPVEMVKNEVVQLYDAFEYGQISNRIAKLITPEGIKPEIKVIFQTLDGLHAACPATSGDWYFSGRYPTPGGSRVANRAFVKFMENVDERAY